MANWKLPYFEEHDQKPFLFYVAFGDKEMVERATEWEGSLHEGLELSAMESDAFLSGAPWEMLNMQQPGLARMIGPTSRAVVIRGEIAGHRSLDYLRETVELLSHLVEEGAQGVYDPLSQAWYNADTWESLAVHGGIFNPFDHIALLATPEGEGRNWLRTRGLRKFGRPDLSVRSVTADELEGVKKMLDRFINHQALGGLVESGRDVSMEGLRSIYRAGLPQGSFEDPDFNNRHIEFTPTPRT